MQCFFTLTGKGSYRSCAPVGRNLRHCLRNLLAIEISMGTLTSDLWSALHSSQKKKIEKRDFTPIRIATITKQTITSVGGTWRNLTLVRCTGMRNGQLTAKHFVASSEN